MFTSFDFARLMLSLTPIFGRRKSGEFAKRPGK